MAHMILVTVLNLKLDFRFPLSDLIIGWDLGHGLDNDVNFKCS